MKRRSRLPELLAPAGDFDCLVAAVKAGADAVYIGGKSFGARAFAKNFEISEIERAAAYCHVHGVKLYVTVNILLSDSELDDALQFAVALYGAGVDALIIADLGLASLIRRYLPKMELHASTQMSVHNSQGADAAYDAGCSRVVLARELSYENIKATTEKCRAEIEVFVHGALCVCHSGQCLFSSLVGGRSGNRGECAQPCRLPYNDGKYPLSLTDLSLAGHIKELCDSGVASLKIEGRMKSPEYVYSVVSVYRRLLDEYRNSGSGENEILRRAFSRGGFTDGYFTGRIQSHSMIGIRSAEDKAVSREVEKVDVTPSRVKIFAKAVMKLGQPSMLELFTEDGRGASAFGDAPAAAIKAPMTETGVKERLCKMGNTFFSLSPTDVELTLDEGINLSPAAINALRRDAVEKLERYGYEREPYSCVEPDKKAFCYEGEEKILTTVMVYNPDEFLHAADECDTSCFDVIFLPLYKWSEEYSFANGVALPPVIMENELEQVREMLTRVKNSGVKYALVGNIGQFAAVKELSLLPVADFRMNITNRLTKYAVQRLGAVSCILSAELTAPGVKSIGGCAIVYGRIPLMLTERCFMRESFGCDKCSACYLTDRRGMKFPMIREWNHRTLILNSALTYMADKESELSGKRPVGRHFIFTVEKGYEIADTLRAYKAKKPLTSGVPMRRMGRRSV